MEKTLVTL